MNVAFPIDLRSDTVTRPTPEMRAAMGTAEVDDDVLGKDPTVGKLEALGAELAGKEAALFVPSGCMANMIGVMMQAPAGSEILVAENSHIHCAEAAAYARVAQVAKWPLKVDAFGRMDPAQAAAAVRFGHGLPGGNSHHPTTSVLCLENTNNYCGGTVQTAADMRAVADAVRKRSPEIKVHLDGARLFNAAAALGVPARDLAAPADSVSFCLSKGLGAPVGSLICGTKKAITQAVALRKMLGGGMRQAGILAAAALHALEHHVERLAEDHAKARRLGEGIAKLGLRVAPEPETNMVMFEVSDTMGFLRATRARALLVNPTAPGRFRAVTHLDVSPGDVEDALGRLEEALAELRA